MFEERNFAIGKLEVLDTEIIAFSAVGISFHK